jgi:hypothetical protein
MAARRGNQSTYSDNLNVYASPDRTTVWRCKDGSTITIRNWEKISEKDFREYSDDELAEAWKRARQRDSFVGLYDKLKKAKSPSGALNCIGVRQALEFLHEATGDDTFQLAAHAMTSHGFTRGGVKQAALSKLAWNKHAIWASMPRMSVWVENEKFAPLKAAKLVAAERGIPGPSFETVVADLRKNYPKWLKSEVGKTL